MWEYLKALYPQIGSEGSTMYPESDSDGFQIGWREIDTWAYRNLGFTVDYVPPPTEFRYEVPIYSEGVQIGSQTIAPEAVDYRSVMPSVSNPDPIPQKFFYVPTAGVPGSPAGSGNYYLIAEKLRTGGMNDWGESPAFNFATIEPNSMYGFRGQAGVNAVTDRLQRKYGATIQAAIDAEYKAAADGGYLGYSDLSAIIVDDGGTYTARMTPASLRALLSTIPGAASDPDATAFMNWLDAIQAQASSFDDQYQEMSRKEGWMKALVLVPAAFGAAAALSAFMAGATQGIIGSATQTLAPGLAPVADIYALAKPLYSLGSAVTNDESATDALSQKMDESFAIQQAAQAVTEGEFERKKVLAESTQADLAQAETLIRESFARSQQLDAAEARALADQAADALVNANATASQLGSAIPSAYSEQLSAAYVAADRAAEYERARAAQAEQVIRGSPSGATAPASPMLPAAGSDSISAWDSFLQSAQQQLSPADYAALTSSLSPSGYEPSDLGDEYGYPVLAESDGAFPWLLIAAAGGAILLAGKRRKRKHSRSK
jgi:hypothetical protein